jgi:hypothetical protein
MSENDRWALGEAGFESRDIAPLTMPILFSILGVLGIIAFVAIWGLFQVLDARERAQQKLLTPLVNAQGDMRSVLSGDLKKFPEPRLETDERNESISFEIKEEMRLHTYGWVDQKAGIMYIPIDRAMQILVQRQLPTHPKVGLAPPAPVNLARQAAEAADQGSTRKP